MGQGQRGPAPFTIFGLETPMAKKAEKKEPMTVKVFPDMTKEEVEKLNEIIERKGHLEYLAMMMLSRLNESVHLRGMLEREVRRETCDDATVEEFCGKDPEHDEYGCCSAEGHTIESLLTEWRETTDLMLQTVADAGRRERNSA